MKVTVILCFLVGGAATAGAQEANSGFDLHATLTAMAVGSDALTRGPRYGSPVDVGFNSILYPTWKLNPHWTVSAVFDTYSRPYIAETFSTQGHGINGKLLRADVSWSHTWDDGFVVVRAGQLTTVFGSFPLRYDEAENPLVGKPMQYGYYYKPVSLESVAGVQIDVTLRKWDARAQFANSSPSHPRSVFNTDQYGNYAAGIGYTVRQGFRIGASGYRGPYLDRNEPFFFPGEAKPSALPARALGMDVQWAAGHWYFQGELQHFRFSYQAIPTYRVHAGYAELKRTIGPRWFLALRTGYINPGATTVGVHTVADSGPTGCK